MARQEHQGGLRPKVSLGLPVYNGEEFLQQALDAILSQTFRAFELIIADNASTDGTRQICQANAARDPRIRYFRNETNIGGARNHNRVLDLSRAEYFKWASHDDIIAPTSLERCVEILDSNPSIILCHSRTVCCDEHGREWTEELNAAQISSPRPQDRFREVLQAEGKAKLIYGLMRTDALRRAGGMGLYVDADLGVVVQLALFGLFYQVPEDLFFKRFHPGMSTTRFSDSRNRLIWWDPAKSGWFSLPNWRKVLGYSLAVLRAPLSLRERLDCYAILARWLAGANTREGWKSLVQDLKVAGRRLELTARQAVFGQKRQMKRRRPPRRHPEPRELGRPSP